MSKSKYTNTANAGRLRRRGQSVPKNLLTSEDRFIDGTYKTKLSETLKALAMRTAGIAASSASQMIFACALNFVSLKLPQPISIVGDNHDRRLFDATNSVSQGWSYRVISAPPRLRCHSLLSPFTFLEVILCPVYCPA